MQASSLFMQMQGNFLQAGFGVDEDFHIIQGIVERKDIYLQSN